MKTATATLLFLFAARVFGQMPVPSAGRIERFNNFPRLLPAPDDAVSDFGNLFIWEDL